MFDVNGTEIMSLYSALLPSFSSPAWLKTVEEAHFPSKQVSCFCCVNEQNDSLTQNAVVWDGVINWDKKKSYC